VVAGRWSATIAVHLLAGSTANANTAAPAPTDTTGHGLPFYAVPIDSLGGQTLNQVITAHQARVEQLLL
jgi:hypothetical protein